MKITEIKMPSKLERKKNVAAYARVSSGKDAMLHSLSSQVSYYSEYIQSHNDWEYVGVYTDEALTGTKQNRKGFQSLIADCKAGKIDLVVTKSISRFARNTVTLLETVRELKAIGIGVYFEEQNIDTLSAEGELILTVLASYAQEESLSVSENVKWRIHNEYRQGILPLSVQNIYGYKRTTNGGFEIVQEEAAVVRKIFKLYLEGYGSAKIAKTLAEEKAPHNTGGEWSSGKVRYILSNEKYIGDLHLQKYYIIDHLTKKQSRNRGEKNQYYVQNNHEPIVPREMFEAVQLEFERRKKKHYTRSATELYTFSGKIKCGKCGKSFKRKTTRGKVLWTCITYDQLGKNLCAAKLIPDAILCATTAEVLGLPEFDAYVFEEKIEKIIVPRANVLQFVFRDGHMVEKKWKDLSRKQSWTSEMRERARQREFERRMQNAEIYNGNPCN